jgi:vitamin B12 transporter
MAVLAGRAFRAVLLLSVAMPAAAVAATIPEIVITANYTPTPSDQIGSSVTIVDGGKITRTSPGSLAQVLRTVPGVTVLESGGPGSSTDVRIRGADTGDTVVLINGVRVNDPAAAHDEFDFVTLAASDIARIEVLRGPQSAIYGSDATGGVINIITRRQTKPSSFTATVEGGSYGTLSTSVAGGVRSGDFTLRYSGADFHTDGFSRRGNTPGVTYEPDGADRVSGTATMTYAPADGPSLEASVTGTHGVFQYDSVSNPNAANVSHRDQGSGYLKMTLPQWGILTQSFTVSGALLDRHYDEPGGSPSAYGYTSSTVTGAYQATLDLARAGTLTAGFEADAEHAHYAANNSGTTFSAFDSNTTDYAAYVQHQIDLFDNLHLTLAGRYDGESGQEGFVTGRAAAAYELPNLGTTLRASIGTGAKRPTAYQIGNNLFYAEPGNAPIGTVIDTDLKPEHSWGADAGIEQALFGGKVHVSATAFYNRFNDLLEFEPFSGSFVNGAYENIDTAESYGLEFSADAEIWPKVLSANVTYTWMPTRDFATGYPLPRRPLNSGSFSLTYTPDPRVALTLTGTIVGARTNTSSSPTLIPGYYRLDVYGSYALSDSVKLFARVDNLTNNVYQDPVGYNAAGLSAYVGLTWNH